MCHKWLSMVCGMELLGETVFFLMEGMHAIAQLLYKNSATSRMLREEDDPEHLRVL